MLRMSQEYKRIIVARTDRIGDVVLSLPVFASLKKYFPQSELTALVRTYTTDVVSSFESVDNVITYDPDESLIATRQKLKRMDADAIIFLFPRFRISAAAFLARIPVRAGTAYRWYSFLFNKKVREHRKDSVKSEAEYNLALAEALGCEEKVFDTKLNINNEALGRVKNFLSENAIEKYIIVHPGSGGSAFEWGEEKFRELIKSITGRLNLPVIVTGTATEHTLCKKVSSGIPKSINAAGKFSLLEFIALLSEAEVFVSNSTGPIHLAAAVDTPVIGIYPNDKPMTPVRWAPITDKKVILTPSDGSNNLSLISVDEVMWSLYKLMSVKTE